MPTKVAMCPNGHHFIVLRIKMQYNNHDYIYCRYCKRSYNKDNLKFKKIREIKPRKNDTQKN